MRHPPLAHSAAGACGHWPAEQAKILRVGHPPLQKTRRPACTSSGVAGRATRLQLWQASAIGQWDRSQGDAGGDFGGMDGARGLRMIGYFFGDRLRELGTAMPEKRTAARAEQAQDAIGDENEAADFEESFENEVL